MVIFISALTQSVTEMFFVIFEKMSARVDISRVPFGAVTLTDLTFLYFMLKLSQFPNSLLIPTVLHSILTRAFHSHAFNHSLVL